MRSRLSVLPVALFLLGATILIVLLSTSGSPDKKPLPAGVVAQVADEQITVAQFNHWLVIDSQDERGRGVVAPDPPRFTKCIASLRRAPQKRPSPAAARKRCEQDYAALRTQVMAFLVDAIWIEHAAAREGLAPKIADVDRKLRQDLKTRFRSEAEFRKFLARTQMTLADARYRISVQLAVARLQAKAEKQVKPPRERELRSFYAKNQNNLGRPESRYVSLIRATQRAPIRAALRALRAGRRFSLVARRYSEDDSARKGGRARLLRGSTDQGIEQQVFSARRGRLLGPLEGVRGFYLIRAGAIVPRKTPSFAAARPQIRRLILQQRRNQALQALGRRLLRDWRPKTRCAPGYLISSCSNGPKPTL